MKYLVWCLLPLPSLAMPLSMVKKECYFHNIANIPTFVIQENVLATGTVRTLLLTAAVGDIARKHQGMDQVVVHMESDLLPSSLEHWVDLQSRKDGFSKYK